MKFVEISFANIKSEIERFLRIEHNKSSLLYSPASPYGQILNVLQELHQLSLFYLKKSVTQFDLSDPNSANPRIIRNAAIFAGHIPGRAVSATGTLKLVVKSGIDLQSELPGGRVTFSNRNSLRNKTNSLDYSLNLGQDSVTYVVNPNSQIFLPIIQGKFRTTTFTGNGNLNQTFQVNASQREKVENFNVSVLVNGEVWEVKKSLYDMIPGEKACVARTGFNGGLDIIFGNNNFGMEPPLSSTIQITYLISSGIDGNIFRRTVNDWNFVDDILDGFGNPIEISSIFDVLIFNDINFGSNEESVSFTRNILPISSNNFVLGLPQQYAYEIKKLGVFSHVNAYESNSIVHIVATPNIKLFKNRNADYFNVSIEAFTLDKYEKSKIEKYLKSNGNIQLTKKYRIDSPKLSYYILNVFVIRYSDSNDDSVKAQIIDKVSEYFLNFNRIDRIPKSDLIKELSMINDIHSVDIQFISRKNEDYHRTNKQRVEEKVRLSESSITPSLVEVDPNYQPNLSLGLDPVLGDIIFEPEEIPIIRGGWYDRNGIFFSNSLDTSALKSINIIKKGVVDSKNRNNF
jgi:hypothetical protein